MGYCPVVLERVAQAADPRDAEASEGPPSVRRRARRCSEGESERISSSPNGSSS